MINILLELKIKIIMKLFNLDCHISVIADLKKIFEDLGHEVTSWSVSGHNWIFNREPSIVEIVNEKTWMSLNQEMCDLFYERYKEELSHYDAFICTYPLSFSMLYEKFNKPIILHIPIRYEVPFHNSKEKWNYFNEYLRKGIDCGKIIPVANSEYDKQYFEFFVKRECLLIQNICEYINTEWKPEINKFLYSSRLNINLPEIVINKKDLGKYDWVDLSKYKGLIVIPYTCSTMSIFEYYTANIPLFFPSKSLIKTLYYHYHNEILSELTWNKIFGLSPGSIIECDRNNDPNNYTNLDILGKWIDLSDFYNEEWMPYIIYFDSFDDLILKLNTTNLEEVNHNMKNFNKLRKDRVYSSWKNILDKL